MQVLPTVRSLLNQKYSNPELDPYVLALAQLDGIFSRGDDLTGQSAMKALLYSLALSPPRMLTSSSVLSYKALLEEGKIAAMISSRGKDPLKVSFHAVSTPFLTPVHAIPCMSIYGNNCLSPRFYSLSVHF